MLKPAKKVKRWGVNLCCECPHCGEDIVFDHNEKPASPPLCAKAETAEELVSPPPSSARLEWDEKDERQFDEEGW